MHVDLKVRTEPPVQSQYSCYISSQLAGVRIFSLGIFSYQGLVTAIHRLHLPSALCPAFVIYHTNITKYLESYHMFKGSSPKLLN